MIALSDANGTIVERYEYDVFGQPTIRDANGTVISESAVGNPYFFTGRRFDNETGLYYYRARYYKPEIGRFLQTDPLGYYDSLNLYTYCWNDPVNWIDPWGLWRKKDHRRFGDGRDRGMDYGSLDEGWTHPWNPLSTGRHFRNRSHVERDLRKAAKMGDKKAFEEHMHEGQDTFSHGEGLKGIIDHIRRGNEPDDPYVRGPDGKPLIGPDGEPIYKPEFEEADEWTKEMEEIWDKYNKEEEGDGNKKGSES